ncbi:hypothetical protein NM688_g6720 [Phlebia brevispora]|uniref:Uncharacterized protein n=1 Tax=Phlebia brevispora TaxID=194682 RepID=A0ACC1SD28_9APHY|nr:hypothetical protein NM688_g6720 [Phlebia brevispora]
MSEVVLKTILPAPLMGAWAIWLASSQLYKGAAHRQKELKVLLFRCRDIVQQLAEHFQYDTTVAESMAERVREVEEVCMSLKNILTAVTEKGLLWCLTHASELESEVDNCERSVDTVSTTIYHMILRNNVQKMAHARKRDQERLTQILSGSPTADQLIRAFRDKGIRESTPADIINTLRNYVQERPARDISLPEDAFIHKALDILAPAPARVEDATVTCIRSADVDVDLTRSIGRGASGQVYIGRWNGAVVAIKRMYPEDARIIQGTHGKAFDNEVRIWSGLHHPNVLDIYGVCTEAEVPFILMRYCQYGTISQYLNKNPDADRTRLAHEVAVGLAFLHSKDIMHGDVKCANILISDDHHALLADFGLSIKLFQYRMHATYSAHMNQQRGTPLFMAPEVLQGGAPDKAADVYSLSLAIWEVRRSLSHFEERKDNLPSPRGFQLFRGDVPYRKFMNMELLISAVVSRNFREESPGTCTPAHVWNVIQRCWVADPHARPMAEEARQGLDPARYSDSHPSAGKEPRVGSVPLDHSTVHGTPPRPAPAMTADPSQESMLWSNSNDSMGTLVDTPLSSKSFSDGNPSPVGYVDFVKESNVTVAYASAGFASSERLDPASRACLSSHRESSRSRSRINQAGRRDYEIEPVSSGQAFPAAPQPAHNPADDPPQPAAVPPPRLQIAEKPVPPSHTQAPSDPVIFPRPSIPKLERSPLSPALGPTPSPSTSPPLHKSASLSKDISPIESDSIAKLLASIGADGSKQGLPWGLENFLDVTNYRNSFAKEIDDFDTFLEDIILDGISVHANVQRSLESVNVRAAMNDREEFAMVATFASKVVLRAMWLAPDKRPGASKKILVQSVPKSSVTELYDHCAKQSLSAPQFCNEVVTDDKGDSKHKVWVIIGKQKYELPIKFNSLSQGQERVAKKVLEQLRS